MDDKNDRLRQTLDHGATEDESRDWVADRVKELRRDTRRAGIRFWIKMIFYLVLPFLVSGLMAYTYIKMGWLE